MASGDRRHHTDNDLEFARQLQRALDNENDDDVFVAPPPVARRKRAHTPDPDPLNATQNLVHPDWETRDPTPNIQALFTAFNVKFFQQKLSCVALEWSRRMYQCAGICYYRRNRAGTSITIRLSEPLLKLRQRKDLVETLLHEMIHAYLFVLNIRESNGGHGPNFKRIMVSINQTAGTNITVYHTFHDEVNAYRTHVWKCNGICQHRQPFYGVVKRTCNRAPGPNDLWWAQHKQSCGGYFAKISEPAKPDKRGAPRRKTTVPAVTSEPVKRVTVRGLDDANNVRQQRIDDPKWGLAKPPAAAKAASTVVGGRTVTAKPAWKRPTANGGGVRPMGAAAPGGSLSNVVGFRDLSDSDGEDGGGGGGGRRGSSSTVAAGGNLRNVVGFRDLNGTAPTSARPVAPQGAGYTLGGGSASGSGSTSSTAAKPCAVIDLVRNVWDKKFGHTAVATPKPMEYSATPSTSTWQIVGDNEDDDDVLVNDVQTEVIELLSDNDDVDDDDDDGDMFTKTRPATRQRQPALTQDQRQRAIKSEILDDEDVDGDRDGASTAADADDDDDDIILIDDEFDDSLAETADAVEASDAGLDHSVIDDIFGTDTLLSDFASINDALPDRRPNAQIITCPICTERMQRSELPEHLNGCLGIRTNVELPSSAKKRHTAPAWKPPPVARSSRPSAVKAERPRSSAAAALPAAPVASPASPAASVAAESASCPSCWRQIPLAEINEHLDECLS